MRSTRPSIGAIVDISATTIGSAPLALKHSSSRVRVAKYVGQQHQPLLVQLDHADALAAGERMARRPPPAPSPRCRAARTRGRSARSAGRRCRGRARRRAASRRSGRPASSSTPHPHRRVARQEQRHALRDQADVEGVGRADPHLPGEAAAAGLEHARCPGRPPSARATRSRGTARRPRWSRPSCRSGRTAAGRPPPRAGGSGATGSTG